MTFARDRTRAEVLLFRHWINFASFSDRVCRLKSASPRIASRRLRFLQAPTSLTGNRLRVYFPPFPAW